jgi:hypothetical protein
VKRFLFNIPLFLLPAGAFAQWGFVNAITPYTTDVRFLNDTIGFSTYGQISMTGYAIGVMRTTDSGTNWDTVYSAANTCGIRGLSISPPSSVFYAFCTGNLSGTIRGSNDMGSTWTDLGYTPSNMLGPLTSGFNNYSYYLANYIQGSLALGLCSGGNCNTVYYWNPTFYCKAFKANDSMNLFILADYVILKSINGGSNWAISYSSQIDTLQSFDFPGPVTGYAVGTGGLIIKTSDAGVTWDTLNSPTTNDFIYVDFANDLKGYAITNLEVYATNDGGATWFSQNMSQSCFLKKVLFPSPNVAYLWTDCGLYSTNYPAGTNEINLGNELRVYPNPAKDGVTISLTGNSHLIELVVSDELGRAICSRKGMSRISEFIDTKQWKAGIYFVLVKDEDGSVLTSKIVITR